jgi:superfamily II DNA or RNA helicase
MDTTNNSFNSRMFEHFSALMDAIESGRKPLDKKEKLGLFYHQRFLYEYFKMHNMKSEEELKNRGLLLYHRLGSGKTISAIVLSEACRDYFIKKDRYQRKVIMMVPASLKNEPWLTEMTSKCFLNCNLIDYTLAKHDHYFIHYNANNIKGGWFDKINKIPSRSSHPNKYSNELSERNNPFDDSVLIIDEVHNLLNSFANEYNSDKSLAKLILYKKILNAKNMKLIALSGTPIINKPSEMAFLFNLLRGGIKHKNKIRFNLDNEIFDSEFFEEYGDEVILKNKKMFMRRINGLVSYYQGYSGKLFADEVIDDVFVPMSGIQQKGYENAKKIERDRFERQKRFIDSNNSSGIFNSNTSKASNVVYPRYVFDKTFQAQKKLTKNGKPIPVRVVDLVKSNGSDVKFVIKPNKEKNEDIILSVMDNDDKPLNINNNLHQISKKAYHIVKKIKESTGPVVVYSRYEGIFGCKFIAEVLRQNGYDKYSEKPKDAPDSPSFMMWTGKEKIERERRRFNLKDNVSGEKIKVFIMSTVGKEGINLRAIRQIHIMEPWWNNVVIKQVIGRGILITS